ANLAGGGRTGDRARERSAGREHWVLTRRRTMDYFPSAEAMAADLDLELLLRAEVDRRMLTRKERLSQFAADATVAGHLYGRVRDQLAREKGEPDLRGKILWMTAPFATVEHLT